MESFSEAFEKVKNSVDIEEINDFLIRIGENPQEEFLIFLDYFINETEKAMFKKIKINIVYVLGEIGSVTKIADSYLQKLTDIYYMSDQWVRNETVQAINKISTNSNLNENIVNLLGNSLNDDYLPVKLGALKVLTNFKVFPKSIFRNFFHVLNTKESVILDQCRRILDKVPLETHSIFEALNFSENYKFLKPRGIRSLLLIKFKSLFNLESFREEVFNSGWDNSFKENFLKEIDIFQSILVKNL
ncbi:MAG: hypothetical protein ACW98D_07185 [Promethearchaeota archaeon]|jgi:hypothetical protein